MTPENEEKKKQFREYMTTLLNATDMAEEEKEDCIDHCPGYLSKVVMEHLKRANIEDKSDHVHTAILGFVGGYASRHLYAHHKKMELKGQSHVN